MPPKKPRVALTKAQIQAGVGAELLTLCQTVTADGVLTDPEVTELRAWLEANRAHDLPAIAFLVATLERILADGRVTRDERKELYAAIEKVLPPEARQDAATQRKSVEAAEKDQTRREREEQKQQERAERERQRPVYRANFMVAGVHYEGRPAVIRRHVDDGDTVFLVRDPGNQYSRHAIEVRLANGMQIGFVPDDLAEEAAPFLDDGCPHVAHVTRILTGGRVPIPIVQAYIHRADADVEDLMFPADVPAKRHVEPRHGARDEENASEWNELDGSPRRSRGTGCVVALPVVCGSAAVLAAARWD